MSSEKREKPKKPYPKYPLYAHSSGQWAKTISGNKKYFKPWDDWQGAFERYFAFIGEESTEQAQFALRGDLVKTYDAAQVYLSWLEEMSETGKMPRTTFRRSVDTLQAFVEVVGVGTHMHEITRDDIRKWVRYRKKKRSNLAFEIVQIESWLRWCKQYCGVLDFFPVLEDELLCHG